MLAYAHYPMNEIKHFMGHGSIAATEKHYLGRCERAKRSHAVPVEQQLRDAAEPVYGPASQRRV